MQLVAPDILAEARGLSLAISISGILLGLLLWLFGWWGHRFWIVLFITLMAGVFGLAAGPVAGVQPLVVALLMAVAAGAMALHLSRVLAFVAAGLATWGVVHGVAPGWNEPLVCFLAGGLLGFLLFRYWTMALTSLGGTLLLTYSTLCLLDRLHKLDAVAWSTRQASVLNWVCAGVAMCGWVVQLLLEQRRARREQKERVETEQLRQKAREKEKEKKKPPPPPPAPPKKALWATLGQLVGLRRAG